MADRRRINGPLGGTIAPLLATHILPEKGHRGRGPHELRKIFLQTGVTPSASGSAYLELKPGPSNPHGAALKLTCTVHGPRPLPRSAPFTPNLLLSTYVKFAPFAGRQRQGYVRDPSERDLAVHLETALRGVVIGDRWPKSGVDVVITVLEGEPDGWGPIALAAGSWGRMTVLAGCITAASAAMADAGIDCVDLVSGGVAAIVPTAAGKGTGRSVESTAVDSNQAQESHIVLDPSPSEHAHMTAACVVAYLATRDELTELWITGDLCNSLPDTSLVSDAPGASMSSLLDHAVQAATAARSVLVEAVRESAAQKAHAADARSTDPATDVKTAMEE